MARPSKKCYEKIKINRLSHKNTINYSIEFDKEKSFKALTAKFSNFL